MITVLRHWRDRWRHPLRYRLFDALMPMCSMADAQLQTEQQRRFNAIVRYAAAQTDFYAQRFAARLPAKAADIDAQTLPVLSKDDVRLYRRSMLSRAVDVAQVRTGYTGGSTGKPLAFYYDTSKHERMLAAMKRGFTLSGWRPGQRILYLWGASRDVSGRGVFAHPATGLLDCERALAAVEYSEAQIAGWLETMMRWRPVLLYGYASALSELADFVIDGGHVPPDSLIGVYSTAEVLQDWQRKRIEQAFACHVFNQYGCREVPNIAWECRAGGLHVFSDLVKLESVPVAGQPSRLVVTSLTDRVMPFVRYDTGDTGRLLDADCDCGLPFPRMQMDMCRHNDLITTCDGRRVHPAKFNNLLYGLTQISRYQWVQTACDRMRLELVCDGALDRDVVRRIEQRLRAEVEPRMSLSIAYVEGIERTRSGKHRFVIGLGDTSVCGDRDQSA